MENFPSIDQIKDQIKDFDASKYVDQRVVTALALLGACKVGYEALYVPGNGFWTHYLQPRLDLKSRYGGADWVLVTGASDGIGEALCHQFARSGFNIVLVSRTLSKLKKVAGDVS